MKPIASMASTTPERSVTIGHTPDVVKNDVVLLAMSVAAVAGKSPVHIYAKVYYFLDLGTRPMKRRMM
jgi:hypothetical protein